MGGKDTKAKDDGTDRALPVLQARVGKMSFMFSQLRNTIVLGLSITMLVLGYKAQHSGPNKDKNACEEMDKRIPDYLIWGGWSGIGILLLGIPLAVMAWCCTKSCHMFWCASLCGRKYGEISQAEGGKKAYEKAKRGAAAFWIDLFYAFMIAGWLVYGSTRVFDTHLHKHFDHSGADVQDKDLAKVCANFYHPAGMIIVGVGWGITFFSLACNIITAWYLPNHSLTFQKKLPSL